MTSRPNSNLLPSPSAPSPPYKQSKTVGTVQPRPAHQLHNPPFASPPPALRRPGLAQNLAPARPQQHPNAAEELPDYEEGNEHGADHNPARREGNADQAELLDPVAPARRAASPRPDAADAAADGGDVEDEQVAMDQDAPPEPRQPQQGPSWDDTPGSELPDIFDPFSEHPYTDNFCNVHVSAAVLPQYGYIVSEFSQHAQVPGVGGTQSTTFLSICGEPHQTCESAVQLDGLAWHGSLTSRSQRQNASSCRSSPAQASHTCSTPPQRTRI
jgi:hypothetical protein